jgi:hypothetical protein
MTFYIYFVYNICVCQSEKMTEIRGFEFILLMIFLLAKLDVLGNNGDWRV